VLGGGRRATKRDEGFASAMSLLRLFWENGTGGYAQRDLCSGLSVPVVGLLGGVVVLGEAWFFDGFLPDGSQAGEECLRRPGATK